MTPGDARQPGGDGTDPEHGLRWALGRRVRKGQDRPRPRGRQFLDFLPHGRMHAQDGIEHADGVLELEASDHLNEGDGQRHRDAGLRSLGPVEYGVRLLGREVTTGRVIRPSEARVVETDLDVNAVTQQGATAVEDGGAHARDAPPDPESALDLVGQHRVDEVTDSNPFDTARGARRRDRRRPDARRAQLTRSRHTAEVPDHTQRIHPASLAPSREPRGSWAGIGGAADTPRPVEEHTTPARIRLTAATRRKGPADCGVSRD